MVGGLHMRPRALAAILLLMTAASVALAAASQTRGAAPATRLDKTSWTVVEVNGAQVMAADPTRAPNLTFDAAGRVSGSDGCNRFSGSYQVSGDALTLGELISTKMACPSSADSGRAFNLALANTKRFRIVGTNLDLLDATGSRVARFERRPATPTTPSSSKPQSAGIALGGTSWQLVKFESGDGKTFLPDDRTKYTIAFSADGTLSVRVDCNRGTGTWKSSTPGQIAFGPLALTRAACPEGSMHDQIVKNWGVIRSYVIQDGKLYLSLLADGGIYEYEKAEVRE